MPLCTLIDGIPSINCPSIGLLTLTIKKSCILICLILGERNRVHNILYYTHARARAYTHTHTHTHTHRMSELPIPLLSRKQSILEKNVSDKSCGVLNDPFNNQSNLWWSHQDQSNVTLNFLKRNLYFSLHILTAHLESFPKHYNKIFFH